jgi:hypothetical protein
MARLRKPLAPPTEKHRDRKRMAKSVDVRCPMCDGIGLIYKPPIGSGYRMAEPCPACNPDSYCEVVTHEGED